MSGMRNTPNILESSTHKKGSKLVVKRGVKLEAYNLFKYVYSEWKHNSHASFQIPRPLGYIESEAMLKRTWVKGKGVSVVYFLTPEKLSGIMYGIKPSVYVEKSAEFLAWLHNLKKALNQVDAKALQQRHVTEMKIIVNSCFESRLIDKNIANNIQYEINRTSRYDNWGPVSVIHGDFKTQNILIAERNLAIIDFESARYDFSYLDLTRFMYNVKVRSNKYPLAIESRTDRLTSMFLKKYEKLCGKTDKRALASCNLRALLEELKTVLYSYPLKARSLKKSIRNFLNRSGLNYIVKEISMLRND